MKNSEIVEVLKKINERLERLENKETKNYTSINNLGWKEISQLSCYKIADFKDFLLKNGQEVRAYVANINPLRFIFAVDGEYRMNAVDTSEGGWEDCRMRLVTMPQIKNLLPDELVEVLEEHDGDKLSLMSQEEYESFDIFKEKTISNLGNLFILHTWYWLKPPYRNDPSYFYTVSLRGGISANYADIARGVLVCFAIKNNQP